MERVRWIDTARGIGVLLIILGHMNISNGITCWIYSFHVPLFFFISGFLYTVGRQFNIFIKRKVISLVIPYYILAGIVLLYRIPRRLDIPVISFYYVISLIIKYLIQIRTSELWFITCLFLTEIAGYMIIEKCSKLTVFFIMFLPLIGIKYYELGGQPLIWNADVCFFSVPFFLLGNKCASLQRLNRIKYIKKHRALCIVFIILMVVNVGLNLMNLKYVSQVDMYLNQYGNLFFYYVSALAGIGAVFIVSHFLSINLIEYIGQNSLVFLLHQNVVMPIVWQILSFVQQDGNILVDKIVEVVLCVCILLLVSFVARSIRSKLIALYY